MALLGVAMRTLIYILCGALKRLHAVQRQPGLPKKGTGKLRDELTVRETNLSRFIVRCRMAPHPSPPPHQ